MESARSKGLVYITHTGGLQKEAYFAGVPCITLDEISAWPETVEDGWNVLVGSNKDRILNAVKHFQLDGSQRDVFGDGRASAKMVGALSGAEQQPSVAPQRWLTPCLVGRVNLGLSGRSRTAT